MAQLRARTHRHSVTSTAAMQAGRLRPGSRHPDGDMTECAQGRCGEDAMPGAPVPLCGKHIRQVYEFAQGVIEDQLISAAVRTME